MSGLPDPVAVLFPVDEVTVYEVIADPPSETGGTNVITAIVLPAVAVTPVGGPGATVAVSATSLETIADDAGFDQISLICDVEGAEVMLVEREIDTLRRRVQLLLIEIHQRTIGEEETSRLTQALEDSGFVLRHRYGINWVFTREFRPLTQTP